MEGEKEQPEKAQPVPAPQTRQAPPMLRGKPDGPPVRMLTREEIDEAMLG